MNKLIRIPLFIVLFFSSTNIALATIVPTKELSELVENADHIFQVTITKVDMVDDQGNSITEPEARTGPGIKNTIRLHAEIQDNGILKTNTKSVPQAIVVELWQMWHYSLGQIQETFVDQEVIFLLKSENFEPVYPAHFQRSLSERLEIVNLIESSL